MILKVFWRVDFFPGFEFLFPGFLGSWKKFPGFFIPRVCWRRMPHCYCIKIKRIRMTCEITQLFCGGFSESSIWNFYIRFIAIDRGGGQLKNQKLENQKNAKRILKNLFFSDFFEMFIKYTYEGIQNWMIWVDTPRGHVTPTACFEEKC